MATKDGEPELLLDLDLPDANVGPLMVTDEYLT